MDKLMLHRRRMGMGAARRLCLSGAIVLAAAGAVSTIATAPAQASAAQPAVGDPFEGMPIRRVLVSAPEGSPSISEQTRQRAINNIRSHSGGHYQRGDIDADARRLNRLGIFKRVEVFAQGVGDGSVDVLFELVERMVVRDVQATGNTKVTDQQIAEQIDLLVGMPVDRFQLDRAARRIEDLYRQRGFYFAQVTIDEELLDSDGIVLFRIREAERLKVTAIRFDGHNAFTHKQLRRELETKTATIFRRGQLDDDKLDADIANLINFYRDRGFLDVRADRRLTPSPNGRETIVTYLVEEGPQYLLRTVEFEVEPSGPQARFSPEQIAGLVKIKPGDVYGVRSLTKSLREINDAYGRLGYTDAQVNRIERRDPSDPVIDLTVVVQENDRYKTGEVIIQGNHITQQRVVRREVDVRPDRPLDTTAIKRTEQQIRRSNLFNPRGTRVTLQPPDPIDPAYRDLLIEIEEAQTGEFNFGGAVSSDSGVVGRIALVQRNFDLFDTPDSSGEFFSGRAFRGAGQTFRLEALPGDRVETYTLGLSDPALFDSDYSGSFNIFYRARDFDEFDEKRIGTRFGFGRRFGTRWRGNLNFRIESIELSNVAPDRPTDVFAVADNNLLTSVGLSLTRSTLNSAFRPTSGTRTRLGIEQVGAIAGDFTYSKVTAAHRLFVPIREDYLGRSTILSLNTEVSYIPQSEDEVPTYERFYLGGQSFRGFDFRSVSPKGIRNDTLGPSDDPVGGTWLFFLGAEVQQPIYEEILSVVAFVDSGTVTNDPGFESYRVSAGIGFRVYFPQLSPAPLAFDFGWPLLKEDDDKTRVFSFTLDVPF